MLSSECAAHFLERDQLLHIDMLECIRRGNATCLYVGERGVLLRDEPSGTFMLSAETKAVVEECLPLMQGAELLVCHQDSADLHGEAQGRVGSAQRISSFFLKKRRVSQKS